MKNDNKNKSMIFYIILFVVVASVVIMSLTIKNKNKDNTEISNSINNNTSSQNKEQQEGGLMQNIKNENVNQNVVVPSASEQDKPDHPISTPSATEKDVLNGSVQTE